jgi:hypothetical protein
MKKLDITGMRYGKLLAIKQNGYDQSPSRKHVKWDCICDCGKSVNVRLNSLRSGNIKSCGCLFKLGNNKTHGMSKTTEYLTWLNIKSRCNNPKNKDYHIYGERGIKLCKEWQNSFETFLKDMGKKPSIEHSIDRIDNNGNYEKNNCRWANNYTQSRNKRNNVFYTYNGKKMCITDWASYLGISLSTLYERLDKWSLNKSLSTFKEK